MRLPCLAALLLALFASCGGPADTNSPAALPASSQARDSVKASLTTPAADATSTTADSTAARTSVTPR